MKKALSLILALTLTFALFPTFAYASTTEETPYDWRPIVFDFRKPTVSDFGGNNYLNGAETYKGNDWSVITYKDWSGLLDGSIGKQQVFLGGSGDGVYIALVTTDAFIDKNKSTFVFGLDVPESGIFNISTGVYNSGSGATAAAVMRNLTKKTDIEIGDVENVKENGSTEDNDKGGGPKNRQFSNGVGIPVAETTNWDTAQNSYDIDNQIELTITKNAAYSFFIHYLTFTPSTINSATVTVDTETEYEIGAAITPTVALNVEGIGNKVYDDLDMAGIVLGVKEEDAGVTVANNVFTVTKESDVTFTPTVTVNGQTHEAAPVTITVASNEPEEDATLTNEFIQETDKETLAVYSAPSVTGTDFTGKVFTAEKNTNGTFTLTAPEKNSDNEAFLYWAKGMETKKRIISFNNIITDYVPAEEGRNYLIAVYEGDIADTTNEYYNLNGQLIAKQEEEPALPSIPGLGTANGWEPCGGNIFVAKYASTTRKAVRITAGDNCKLDKDAYAYGDLVTCTANGEGKFKCWKKNGEIVSVDEAYSFNAWEDCNVEAVYENYTYNGSNMNILIDSFTVDAGVTGVMAEFIGFENEDVIEKGIKFTDSKNNKIKIPMTTTANQLAVIADAGKYEGYAILRSGDVYQMITDGSYEHN